LHPGGIQYNGWVFNGQIPGPLIVVNQGDLLQVEMKNRSKLFCSFQCNGGDTINHSLADVAKPGESKITAMRLEKPGIYLYYSLGDSLNGVWEQIANGLFGAIIVRPRPEITAKFFIIFSELYSAAEKGPFIGASEVGSFDIVKFLTEMLDLVLTNGVARRYMPPIGQITTCNFRIYFPRELLQQYQNSRFNSQK
jgi:hypothetical protein